jgi:hypothetical protein
MNLAFSKNGMFFRLKEKNLNPLNRMTNPERVEQQLKNHQLLPRLTLRKGEP